MRVSLTPLGKSVALSLSAVATFSVTIVMMSDRTRVGAEKASFESVPAVVIQKVQPDVKHVQVPQPKAAKETQETPSGTTSPPPHFVNGRHYENLEKMIFDPGAPWTVR